MSTALLNTTQLLATVNQFERICDMEKYTLCQSELLNTNYIRNKCYCGCGIRAFINFTHLQFRCSVRWGVLHLGVTDIEVPTALQDVSNLLWEADAALCQVWF